MNANEHFFGKVAVKGMIAKDGKVLITRSVRDPDTWDFPGGRIHENESLEGALLREIKEEIGVDVRLDGIVCSEQVLHISDGKTILFVTFLATPTDASQEIVLATGDMEEKKWIDRDEFPSVKVFGQCVKPLRTFWKLV